jgi:hypothetical protein
MNDLKIDWYRFVDTYDQFHKHGLHAGHNFMLTVKSKAAYEALTDIVSETRACKIYSDSVRRRNQSDDTSSFPRVVHVLVQDEIDAMTIKMRLV